MSRKVTDDTAITGANLATGDLFDVVDISDATDAATGTNKSIAASEMTNALVVASNLLGLIYASDFGSGW